MIATCGNYVEDDTSTTGDYWAVQTVIIIPARSPAPTPPLFKMALRFFHPVVERSNTDSQPRHESEVGTPGVAPGGL